MAFSPLYVRWGDIGVLADPELFELCSRGWAALDGRWDEIVRRAMAVKIQVIQEDPY